MKKRSQFYPEKDGVNDFPSILPVISGQGATRTLLDSESGSLVLFDRAAGTIFTLPKVTADGIGMFFEFQVLTSVSTNNDKIITDAATTFLAGSLVNIDTDTSNAVAAWTGDGATHVAITMNGTTTGGLQGTRIRLTAISKTLWMVEGIDQGSSTVATPFATS